MTEMFGEAWSPMSIPDLAPDDDDVDRFDEGMEARITPNRSPCSGRHQSTPSPINNPGSWGQSATQMEKASKMTSISITEKEERHKKLEDELSALDDTLAKLMREKAALQQKYPSKLDQDLPASTLKHYRYILPLVREVYLLELKVKEQKKIFDEKKWKCEAMRLGQDLLAATLNEENCVLKRWSNELSQSSGPKDGTMITNKSYYVQLCDDCLKEILSFTAINQRVHVSLKISTETSCERIHFLHPSTTRFQFSSDTFIPGLEEKVKSSLSHGSPVSDIVSLVTVFIQEDMAPFVINVSPKKKSKTKTVKPKPEAQIISDLPVQGSNRS